MKKSTFYEALEVKDFSAAMQLLKESLREARILNPLQDETWAPPADQLGYAILAALGAEACQRYWQELLDYFQKELEPSWGHTHKGHTYFRMGFAWLGTDLAKARSIIRESVAEDTLYERSYQRQLGLRVPMEDAMARYPSFVFLRFLDLIQDAACLSQEHRRTFFEGLVPTHWDVIWGPKTVDDRLVRTALRTLVSADMAERVFQILDGVQSDFVARNGPGLIASTASLVDTLVFDRVILRSGGRGGPRKGTKPLEPSLAELLLEAREQKSFPRDSIWSVFQSADLLARSLCRRPRAREHSDSVLSAMGVGVKILVDLALVEWADQSGKKQRK